MEGFQTVFERTNFGYYMINGLVVTVVSMALILLGLHGRLGAVRV